MITLLLNFWKQQFSFCFGGGDEGGGGEGYGGEGGEGGGGKGAEGSCGGDGGLVVVVVAVVRGEGWNYTIDTGICCLCGPASGC